MTAFFGGKPLILRNVFNLSTKRKAVSNLASRSRKPSSEPKKKVNPLYKEFLNSLSSTEKEAYKDVEKAMPAFRKFIDSKSDAELVVLVTK